MTAFDFLLVILCIRPDRMNEPDRMNVMGDVDTLAKLVGYADPIATVSLGQGQEPVAEKAISLAHKAGGWVVLQNIHLTPGWTASKGLKDLVGLENILDKIAVGAHPDFRLFLTAEPSAAMPMSSGMLPASGSLLFGNGSLPMQAMKPLEILYIS